MAVADDAVRGLPSPGVTGVFTAEQALKQILAGTGVTYRLTGPEAVGPGPAARGVGRGDGPRHQRRLAQVHGAAARHAADDHGHPRAP